MFQNLVLTSFPRHLLCYIWPTLFLQRVSEHAKCASHSKKVMHLKLDRKSYAFQSRVRAQKAIPL